MNCHCVYEPSLTKFMYKRRYIPDPFLIDPLSNRQNVQYIKGFCCLLDVKCRSRVMDWTHNYQHQWVRRNARSRPLGRLQKWMNPRFKPPPPLYFTLDTDFFFFLSSSCQIWAEKCIFGQEWSEHPPPSHQHPNLKETNAWFLFVHFVYLLTYLTLKSVQKVGQYKWWDVRK